MKSKLLSAKILFILFLTQAAFGLEADFQRLGHFPGSFPECKATGVSGDGSVVVGERDSCQGFYWTAEEGTTSIGNCRTATASYDGSVIVGATCDWEGFYWTEDSGLIRIGDLPGGDFYSIASDVSYDGTVIVGQGKSSNGFEAFRWTASTGMQGLGDLPGGGFDSRGFAVSPDGSIVVGTSKSSMWNEAFIWTESTGMIGLGTLPGSLGSSAYGVTEDGSIVVGRCYSGRGEAFMWTASTGMVGLGFLPGWSNSWARDVSADGSVVVGCCMTDIGWEAFIWDESNGMRNLKEVLENDFGLDLTGWTLNYANGISADGTVIVGRGDNPEGKREAWVVTFYEPAIEAKVKIVPNTLNLSNKGKCISCNIRLPEDYDVTDVNSNSVKLENEVEAS